MTGDKNAFTRCFKLVTGSSNDKHDHGFLTVLLDRGNGYIIEKASAYYKINSVVYDECLPFGTKLAIENKNKDAWAGTITVDGNSMTCTNCDQGKSTLKIVCDGNDDASSVGNSKCLNGKRCFLEPKSSTARHGCCPFNKYMSNPFSVGNSFSVANSCSACPTGQLAISSLSQNDDTSCNKLCPSTQVPNSDKAATNSITGIMDASVTVTCDPGWSGTGATVCGKKLQWSPVRVCSVNSCTPTQVANSDKSIADSITGMSSNFFFNLMHPQRTNFFS